MCSLLLSCLGPWLQHAPSACVWDPPWSRQGGVWWTRREVTGLIQGTSLVATIQLELSSQLSLSHLHVPGAVKTSLFLQLVLKVL